MSNSKPTLASARETGRTRRFRVGGCWAVWLWLVTLASHLVAKDIPLPNSSFELPRTFFAGYLMEYWQKFPKPPEYDDAGGFEWVKNMGSFANTAVGQPDHLDNIDGTQAGYLFNVKGAGIFQDYDSVDANDPAPTHAFNAKFEAGKFYSLTVGVNGGGGNMPEGTTMEMSLYYRDANGEKVTVGACTITHTSENFPVHTHFYDYQVRVPVVQPADAWAGKNIGVQFRATGTLEGGYWDLDFVRLQSGPDPVTVTRVGSDARVAWATLAGYQYQLQSSGVLDSGWTNEGAPRAGTGAELFTLFPIAPDKKFFQVLVTGAPSS